MQIVFRRASLVVFWGASKFSNLLAPRASKFFGGPVSFQIYWPPGPLDPQAQCQGLPEVCDEQADEMRRW